MSELINLESWLRHWFDNEGWEPYFVGIFGSAAMNVPKPGDYDLLIVVPNSFENGYWSSINRRRSKLIGDAATVFRTPLSPIMLSLTELSEANAFTKSLFSHPITNVLGTLNR